jgi:hypothetical protein
MPIFKSCDYRTNAYSFNSHKSRTHQVSVRSGFCDDIVCQQTNNSPATSSDDLNEECPGQSTEIDDASDNGELRNQLKQNGTLL